LSEKEIQIDQWPWGREKILWGYDLSHHYTYKVLEPKKGRAGCLSLQYHHQKSESWAIFRGVAWGMVVVQGTICTRIMRPGDLQNLPTGVMHTLTGITDDLMVLEASTPDRHAADKSVPKDVVRLHCFYGRPCVAPRDKAEAEVLARCLEIAEEALQKIDAGQLPPEYNLEFLRAHGAHSFL
jgi:mannose-6-phosphate isomerase-like protein (cupin superfamily)